MLYDLKLWYKLCYIWAFSHSHFPRVCVLVASEGFCVCVCLCVFSVCVLLLLVVRYHFIPAYLPEDLNDTF